MGARLHDGTIEFRSGLDCTVGPRSGPDCTVGPLSAPTAPSGPDQGAIALSLLPLLIQLEGGILSKTGGEVGPGRVPQRFWEGVALLGDIA